MGLFGKLKRLQKMFRSVRDRVAYGDYSDYKYGDGPSGRVTGFTITDSVERMEIDD